MGVEIDEEVIRLINYLRKQGKSRNQVSELLGISWSTVNKYWEEKIKAGQFKKIEDKKYGTISREDYMKIYTLLEEGKSKVDIVKETGVGDIIDSVFNQYCKDKGIPNPQDVLSNVKKLKLQVDKIQKNVDLLIKKLDEVSEKSREVSNKIIWIELDLKNLKKNFEKLKVFVQSKLGYNPYDDYLW